MHNGYDNHGRVDTCLNAADTNLTHHARVNTMQPVCVISSISIQELLQNRPVIKNAEVMKAKGEHHIESLSGFVLGLDFVQVLRAKRNVADLQTQRGDSLVLPLIELSVSLQCHGNDLTVGRVFLQAEVLSVACVNDSIHDIVKNAVEHQIISVVIA